MSANLLPAKMRSLAFAGLLSVSAFSQPAFPGFTSGNLVVTRTVYTGDATTVTAGQALPPVCPSTASCKTVATDNGAYPAAGVSNNVWNNNKADGSFGITSPIFLDQLTATGTLVNTLPIPSNLVTTSFSSKSELAINLTSDGSALTFMAYGALANTLDVSNSNTPFVYDPTNPAGGSYFRAVVQVGANGAIQVTNTNAYSGNNGRAAVLANGNYYMVGNSNNGTGTPTNVVASTGVQMAAPGQASNTAPTAVGSFSITQVNDPATGLPYAADKLGKDNNFRGLTVFNNTLYVTKGSGGNGINTVYQVGAAGSLPTAANAATAPITVLPGFTTILAKNTDVNSIFPFGIWFANATTLYVADEGDGVAADAATSKMAGLQKWSLVTGKWQLDYVLQNGLNLGQMYSISGYPAALNPATAGLRNITGKVNADGTATIYGVTATVSPNGDQGADPNKLVAINDVLAHTATAAASSQFITLKTAVAGELLRGVSLAPVAGATPMASVPTIVSAASPSVATITPGSLAFAFGQNIAGAPGEIIGPLPTAFGGTSVNIVDSAGKSSSAQLAFVSPSQITFLVPAAVAAGPATIGIASGANVQSASNVQIANIAPAIFTVNGSSLATAYVVHVASNGAQTSQPTYTQIGGDAFGANPITVGAAGDTVVLVLAGTGIQAAGTSGVKVTMGGVDAPVLYAGTSNYLGLDQVNVLLPASLSGKGTVMVQLTASGVAANPVQIVIQ